MPASETVESRLAKSVKQATTGGDKGAKKLVDLLLRYKEALEQGKSCRTVELVNEEEVAMAKDLYLLTNKPVMYVCNVDDASAATGNKYVDAVREAVKEENAEILQGADHLLGLQTFFTAGADECRAWTIHKGDKAPKAAGVIHTDFERGFIRAEVIKYEDFVSLGSESAARAAGKLATEGKEYVVQDGDIMHFLFNV